MRYLSMYRSQTSATSADSKFITSNYIEHPSFDFADALCSAFHYLFIRYVPDITYSKGYALRSAIKDFLEFREQHNIRLHPELQIKAVEDIGVEEFNLFVSHLRRKGQTVESANRLKSALTKVARNNDDGLPLLIFPLVQQPVEKPREPFSESTDADFYTFMRAETDTLRRKLEFRREVDNAVPYTLEEARTITCELLSLQGGSVSTWKLDPVRALRTLILEGYPFEIGKDYFNELRKYGMNKVWLESVDSPATFVINCCLPNGALRDKAPGSLCFAELMYLYYLTVQEQATLAVFIQRQCGWNKESVLTLDKERYLHPLSKVANSDVVMMISEKKKSQSSNKNSERPKTVWSLSSRSDKYSGYNSILLAIELSKPLHALLASTSHLLADDKRKSSVFLFIPELDSRWWLPADGRDLRFTSLHNQDYWDKGVRLCLQKAQLAEKGKILNSGSDIEGRLRVTWVRNERKNGKHPIALTALQLGHESVETTSINYDSSAAAMSDRKERYRDIQEDLMQCYRENKFQGMLGNANRAKPESATFRIFTIVGHGRALWACQDSSAPNYPGSVKLENGERCTRLAKCLFCNQIYVLGDSLPFLIERLSTLQRSLDEDEGRVYEHQDEIQILEFIIRNWGDDTAVSEALVYMRQFEALLPYNLGDLIAFIEG